MKNFATKTILGIPLTYTNFPLQLARSLLWFNNLPKSSHQKSSVNKSQQFQLKEGIWSPPPRFIHIRILCISCRKDLGLRHITSPVGIGSVWSDTDDQGVKKLQTTWCSKPKMFKRGGAWVERAPWRPSLPLCFSETLSNFQVTIFPKNYLLSVFPISQLTNFSIEKSLFLGYAGLRLFFLNSILVRAHSEKNELNGHKIGANFILASKVYIF